MLSNPMSGPPFSSSFAKSHPRPPTQLTEDVINSEFSGPWIARSPEELPMSIVYRRK